MLTFDLISFRQGYEDFRKKLLFEMTTIENDENRDISTRNIETTGESHIISIGNSYAGNLFVLMSSPE